MQAASVREAVSLRVSSVQDEEDEVSATGDRVRRQSVAVGGEIAGYVGEGGARAEIFTDVPEVVLGQRGNPGPYTHARAAVVGEKGSGFVLLCPRDSRSWNGEVWAVAHGAIPYAELPRLPTRRAGELVPLLGRSDYTSLMVDRGAAVVFTRRSSAIGAGDDEHAWTDSRRLIRGLSFAYHLGLVRGLVELAVGVVRDQLGRPPERILFVGHSAGASLGRLLNYVPAGNVGRNRQPFFDGFLLDDAGGGFYLPPDSERDTGGPAGHPPHHATAPQVDVVHQAYRGDDGQNLHRHRENFRRLHQRGCGDRVRMYEIAGVSHFDAGRSLAVPAQIGQFAAYSAQCLDLSGVFEALIDNLSRWVAGDVAPPASCTDAPELRSRYSCDAAVRLPEVACPLGVYYAFPEGSPARMGRVTGFAPFSGAGVEPVDGYGRLVDMNGNGVRDQRETLVAAWQRMGLVRGPDPVDGQAVEQIYRTTVRTVADELYHRRLLGSSARRYYAGVNGWWPGQ